MLGEIPARYDGRMQLRLEPVIEGSKQRGHSGNPTAVSGNGHVQVEGLQPGRYAALILVLVGGRPQQVARTEIEVAAGSLRHALPLPALHAVTLVGAEAGHAHISSVDRSGGSSWFAPIQVPADSEGVTVDGLPAGEYQASNGSRRVTFRVPGPEVVRF